MHATLTLEGYSVPGPDTNLTERQWFTLWTSDPSKPPLSQLQELLDLLGEWRAAFFAPNTKVFSRGRMGIVAVRALADDRCIYSDGAPGYVAPFARGALVTRDHGGALRIVSRVVGYPGGRMKLHALHLPPSCVTEEVTSVDGWRLADAQDERDAQRDAARFVAADVVLGDQPNQSGGAKASGRTTRKGAGKLSSSHVSSDATRETHQGSAMAAPSHTSPSHSAKVKPSDTGATSASAIAASDKRKPKPKKRRMPRDHVS